MRSSPKKTNSDLKRFITYHLSTAASDRAVFLLLEQHYPAMRAKLSYATYGQSLRNMCRLRAYTYTNMVKGALLLGLVYVGAKYVARNYSNKPTIDSDNKA